MTNSNNSRSFKKQELNMAINEILNQVNTQLDSGKLDHLSSSEILLGAFESLAISASLAAQGYSTEQINEAFKQYGKHGSSKFSKDNSDPIPLKQQTDVVDQKKKISNKKVNVRKINKGNETVH